MGDISKNLKNKGLTIIELLVVIAIIGLLATVGLVALTSGRQKARDAKRIADLNQIQKALEMYYNEHSPSEYPSSGTNSLVLGKGSGTNSCNGGLNECTKMNINGIVHDGDTEIPIFMGLIPADPSAGTGSVCNGSNTAPCHYRYNVTGGGSSYKIDFYLERGVENLAAGNQCLTQSGFLNRNCL